MKTQASTVKGRGWRAEGRPKSVPPRPSALAPRPCRSAFTLVELLVVITIIVILLALLTPALEKAIYQAQLTLCGATLKTLGQEMTTSAMERKRRYPDRPLGDQWIELAAPTVLVNTPLLESGPFGVDNRPALDEYLDHSLNALINCPLQTGIDLESPPASINLVAGGYGLYHGWRAGPGEKPMKKIGDRWTYKGRAFGLLATDYEMRTNTLYSTHPDKDGVLIELVYQGISWEGGAFQRFIDTYHNPDASGSSLRGLIDRNFLYSDLSVNLLMNIEVYPTDERMTTVPMFLGSGTTTLTSWEQVPN